MHFTPCGMEIHNSVSNVASMGSRTELVFSFSFLFFFFFPHFLFLPRTRPFYHTGDVVNGTIYLNCIEPFKCRGLHVEVSGLMTFRCKRHTCAAPQRLMASYPRTCHKQWYLCIISLSCILLCKGCVRTDRVCVVSDKNSICTRTTQVHGEEKTHWIEERQEWHTRTNSQGEQERYAVELILKRKISYIFFFFPKSSFFFSPFALIERSMHWLACFSFWHAHSTLRFWHARRSFPFLSLTVSTSLCNCNAAF